MKRLFCLLGVLVLLLSFWGCSNSRLSELDRTVDSEQEKIMEIQKIIVDALNEQDENTMKQYLSQRALESPDLEEGFAYIWGLFRDEITVLEKKGCPVHETLSADGDTKMLEGNFVLADADEKRFTLHFEFWSENEIDPDKEGINLIKMTEYRERTDNAVSASFTCAGIYNPAWDEDPDKREPEA